MRCTLLLMSALACSPPPPEAPADEAPPTAHRLAVAPATTPPVEHLKPASDGVAAQRGLDARIAGLRKRMAADPKARAALPEALRLRATLFGRVSDLSLQLRIAEDGAPEDRARAALALHQFDEAVELDDSLADAVALARHQDLDRLETQRRAAMKASPSADTWTALADVLLAQGRPADADAAYAMALVAYTDVSPLYVADLQFRRGYAWGETGPEDQRDPARARALYEEAITVLPGFVRAHVHLAELEWQAGEKSAAIARVRRVVDAEDPEPAGKLAVWLEGEEAALYRQQTTTRYEALLARHPLAFADHAAEFFTAVGDLDRARELAVQDRANRATPRSIGRCEELGCPPK